MDRGEPHQWTPTHEASSQGPPSGEHSGARSMHEDTRSPRYSQPNAAPPRRSMTGESMSLQLPPLPPRTSSSVLGSPLGNARTPPGVRSARISAPRMTARVSQSGQPSIELSNRQDEECTVIRVAAENRPGLLLDLTEHLKAQQLTIDEATVQTHGRLSVDVFHVKDVGTGAKISGAWLRGRVAARSHFWEARCLLLKESLERLCGAVAAEDGWELSQHLGDTATLRAHIMAREQWEIERETIDVDEDACLGRGSFGEVHRGLWRGCDIAVKRLRDDMANERELLEFRRELAIVNYLAHPNIVQFLGAITVAQPLCIVSEFMPGGNLADLLAKRDGRPFPIGKSLGWMLDTTKGMRYLHERRPTMIIHRDLKPENLLLDASQRVKITDFGLSKSAMQLRGPRSSMSEEQTVSRTTCGTWLYTAPEVYKKEPYSAKVDQFAFSMIMFELLMGVAPFKALNAEEATVQIALGKRPEFTRPVVATLRDLVTRLWQHDPALRPPFGDVQRVLDEYRATLTPADYTEDRHSIRMSLHAAQGHPAAEPGPSGGCCTIQ